MDYKLSIVIPAYNEGGNIRLLLDRLVEELKNYPLYEVIVVDDGSKDNTPEVVRECHNQNQIIKLISLSRNFGHQNALKAGLDHAKGDCIISMDADLQHPPSIIPEMIEKWKQGYDIVYTLREREKNIPVFKKLTSVFFYRIFDRLSNIDLQEGAADFRLISSAVADVLKNNLNEYYLFYRGLISWIGFQQFAIYYKPDQRYSGKTKYSLRKMLEFSLNGITSFSIKPLRIAIFLGLFMAVISFFYALYALYTSIFTTNAIQGWTSVIISILFIGGIQMIILGIMGEYIGKTYFEVKRRPHYIIKESKLD